MPDTLVGEVLSSAASELVEVLLDADVTVTDPDYDSGETLACYRGNPLLDRYVMVDYIGNVVRVRRYATSAADEHFTLTYLPCWFYAVLRRYIPLDAGGLLRARNHESCLSAPTDRYSAVPIEVGVKVVHALPRGSNGARVLQVAYDVDPSEPAAVLHTAVDPANPPDSADLDRVHWAAPKVRIVAAPGVQVSARPLYPTLADTHLNSPPSQLAGLPWGEAVMTAAGIVDSATRVNAVPVSTCDQALSLQIERRQDAASLPRHGGARRDTGVAEADLLAAAGSFLGAGLLRFEETTRPDGIDLDLLTPKASAALAGAPLDLLRMAGSGGLSPFQPVPIRIRIDPQSAEDAFAYHVCYLDRDRAPVDKPAQANPDGLCMRLSVERTESVNVYVDSLIPAAAGLASRLVEYRERIVASPVTVPAAILDRGESLAVVAAGLPTRPLTAGDVFDATVFVVSLVPWPPCQVAANMSDYARLLSYLASGKDLIGREMTPADAVFTLIGLLTPQAIEVLAAKLGRMLATPGMVRRLLDAVGVVRPAELDAAARALLKFAEAQ